MPLCSELLKKDLTNMRLALSMLSDLETQKEALKFTMEAQRN